MVVYPLSFGENRTVRWATRIIPVAVAAAVVLMATISAAATPM
jgi:hypothetical protein